jgi:hypothetical protein
MGNDDGSTPRVLASSTLCTVQERDDGTVDIDLGNVILRLSKRDVASLTGTLHRVVRQLFKPHGEAEDPPPLPTSSPQWLRLVYSRAASDDVALEPTTDGDDAG